MKAYAPGPFMKISTWRRKRAALFRRMCGDGSEPGPCVGRIRSLTKEKKIYRRIRRRQLRRELEREIR